MKILLGDKEHEIKFTSLAVETVEEHYEKSIDEVMEAGMKAKDYNFILWASIADAPDLETTKKLFAEKYTYMEIIKIFNKLVGSDPNEQRAEDTEKE
jgi:hypothetical protein